MASPAPLWQSFESGGVLWDWLAASDQPAHAELGWQCERLWLLHKTQARSRFGAILCLLEWEDRKMPVFSIIMCMTLADSDGGFKKFLLMVEPRKTETVGDVRDQEAAKM